MRLSSFIPALAANYVSKAAAAANSTSYFRVTALVTTSANTSALQCWQLSTPLTSTAQAGISGALMGSLGTPEQNTYTLIPPHFDGGLHTAPSAQLVVFLSGLAVISLPSKPATSYVLGGANGIIIAADTRGSGHYTRYPSDQPTSALAIPFKGGRVPEHAVVNATGPCQQQSPIYTNPSATY